MEKKLAAAAERYLNSLRQNKRRTQMLRCVAVLVVLATISALVMPALTMSNEVECGLAEHIHTESCWSEQLALPEPELTCTAGVSGEVVVHTHDEYCWDSQGNLICNLPETEAHIHSAECYQEHRTLTCEQTAEPGHQHDASCYAYVRAESPAAEHAVVYTCGMQEGEGAHQHMEECYPQERVAEPLCGLEETGDEYDGEGNLIQQGHRHTDECWLVRVHEKLVCGLEETENEYDEEGNLVREGHAHSASCWLTGNELCLRYGCGQQERAGHVHTDACTQGSVQVDSQGEQWEQVLVCGEQEREPGHVHTDECYEITQMLTCRRQELTAHTHNAGCCDEDGALICGLTEVLVHQHTDACFATPEGGPEPARVLVCGKEEHTHTDLCYVKVLPEEERETFYCGQEEHVHSLEECYFPSGGLKCTLGEHVHDMTCMIPPAEESDDPLESGDPMESDDPQQSQGPEEPGQGDDSQIWVDESYVHETEAFRVIFQVTGWAKPAEDGQEAEAAENELWISDFAPEVVSTPSYEEGLVELVSQRIPLAALPMGFSASLDPDALPGADPFAENNRSEADTGPAGPVGSVVEDNRPAPSNEPVQIAPQEEDEPVVIPTPEITPSFTPIPEISPEPVPTPEAAERLELVVEQLADTDPEYQRAAVNAQLELGEEESTVVDVLRIALYAGNQKMDLSGCEVTAVVEATQELKDAMEAQEAMTADEDGPQTEDMEDAEEPSFAMTDEEGAVMAFSKLSEAMEVEVTDEIVALSAVPPQVYPNFTVQYYAYLETVDTNASGTGLTLIDTQNGGTNEGGKLPKNGTGESSPVDGNELKNMYLDADGNVIMRQDVQEIYRAHQFNYKTAPRINFVNIVAQASEKYTLEEIWVQYDGNPENLGDAWQAVPEGDSPDGLHWKKIAFSEKVQFTNWERTANEHPEYILIQPDAVIRLVYKPKGKAEQIKAVFYDYDISNGGVRTNGDVKIINTAACGINSKDNCAESVKYAFGNNNAGTNYGTVTWNGNELNKANKAGGGYKGCTFGLVKDELGSDGLVQFNVPAPKVFGNETQSGKTIYNKEEFGLNFNRQGDTYTLSSVAGTATENLEKFQALGKSWSNSFWPMDSAPSWGTGTHDMKSGNSANKENLRFEPGDSIWKALPVSDDGQDHNSYFGMNFAIKFEVTPDYVGPLEYYFFGDDDMWVFLDGKLICDIGGVHSSVGEYVNLWDYIKKDNTVQDHTANAGAGASANVEEHTLTFFYTERGASGSTCWMQFTLPEVTAVNLKTGIDPNEGNLEIAKVVEGPVDPKKEFEFILELDELSPDLTLGTYKYNTSGEPVEDKSDIVIDGTKVSFRLCDGESFAIAGLKAGVGYTLTESEASRTGYNTSYAGDGGSDQGGGVFKGTVQGGKYVKVICTNSASYELPSTGGAGTWYTMACVPLAALLCLMYKKKSKGEGDGG